MANLFQQINALRKEGKLDEALVLTNDSLSKYPNDEWIKKAAVWVYYDFLKKAHENEDFVSALNWIACFDSLALKDEKIAVQNFNRYRLKISDTGEQLAKVKQFIDQEKYIKALEIYDDLALSIKIDLIKNDYAWTIYRFLKQQITSTPPKLDLVNKYINIYTNFGFGEISLLHSIMLQITLKFSKNKSVNVFRFLQHWGWDMFREEDKERFVTQDGKTLDSTCEKALQTFVKLLLENLASPFINSIEQKILKNETYDFIEVLESYIPVFKDNYWLAYHRVKLLMAVGTDEDILEEIFELVRKKPNDFWIWDLMGTYYQDIGNNQMALASFCKGLLCKTQPEFYGSLREKLIQLLLKQQKYNEAKTELNLLIEVKNNKGFKISKKLTDWQNTDWYKNASTSKNNLSLYKKEAPLAEAVLFSHLPVQIGIITQINKEKNLALFVISKTVEGNFKQKLANFKPQLGQFIELNLEEQTSKEGKKWNKVVAVRLTDKKPSCDVFKEIEDSIRIIPSGIGFTKSSNIYISKELIELYQLTTGQKIRGKAFAAYDKKKKAWGWKLLLIEK